MQLGMTVAELERRLGAGEFREWQAYSRIEPFGDRRADARTWALIAHIGNALNAFAGGKGEPVDLRQILAEWQPPESDEVVARKTALFFETKIHSDNLRGGAAAE